MKKLLTLTAVGTLLAVPAMAVQQCVALDSSTTTCTSTPVNWNGTAEWEVTCTTDGTNVPIKGVSACSNVKGDTDYAIYSDGALPTLSDASSEVNFYCWCKMVEPAVSSWVYTNIYTPASNCAFYCSGNCATHAQYYPEFRSALFSSISN
ncbi:MAG: hypothetical protein IKB05_00380 [Alphaproteobacteria bacterium]|nr:hypothetical protein [Alphaproteobacteria bacterium]